MNNPPQPEPWRALWALVIGFFMILLDTTIVSIANPAILNDFVTDITAVIWATSAYLLAYAVPLLITGRLGDRYGPKRIYLLGLTTFTVASLACGLSTSITSLIAARAVQGMGAALMSPQTMAVITRIFPSNRRGAAMGLWGAVAGVATAVGPVLGGVLVDSLGWRWIFFVNVPIGVIAFVAAWWLVPTLELREHRFDWLGVVLCAVGMFLVIFGVQEGESYDWSTIMGPITVPGIIVVGVVTLVAFAVWQRYNKGEPLLPFSLFRDRNFALANPAIALVGLTFTAMPLPLAFYFQVGWGLSVTYAALMLLPRAVVSGILSPFVGRLSDIVNAKWVAFAGFCMAVVAMVLYIILMTSHADLWLLLVPSALLGVGASGIWAPLASTATRTIAPVQAGAASGVYNMTRQMGSVLGSALIAAVINARLIVELPGVDAEGIGYSDSQTSAGLPPGLFDGYSTAMAQSLWVATIGLAICSVVVLLFSTRTKKTTVLVED